MEPGQGQICKSPCIYFDRDAWEQGHVRPCSACKWDGPKYIKPHLDDKGLNCNMYRSKDQFDTVKM
jgi:hypothetical protein